MKGSCRGEERATLLEMLLLTLPGAICHYYGDELPLPNAVAPAGSAFGPQHGLMQWSSGDSAGFSSAAPADVLPPGPVNASSVNFEDRGVGNTLRKLFTRLAGLRQKSQTLMDGTFEILQTRPSDGVDGGSIITVRRPKAGTSGKVFITVLNFAKSGVMTADLTAVRPPSSRLVDG